MLGAVLLAAPAAAQPTLPQCAAGEQVYPARTIAENLPVGPRSSPADLADFALPYAMMAANAEERREDWLAPYGFVRGPDSVSIFSARGKGEALRAALIGFYGTVYFHCNASALVVVLRSMSTLDARDWAAGLWRRANGEATMALAFFDAVREAYPDYSLAVVGHSAAGAVASYVAAERNVPSVVFNPTRTDFALQNDGSQQLIVIINGDVFSDPDVGQVEGVMAVPQALVDNPGRISGTELRIEPRGDYRFLWELHFIDVIVDELNWILGRQ